MDEKNLSKLTQLIRDREKTLKVIRVFDDLFFQFSRAILKNSVLSINNELIKYTDDNLKLFYDDPYEIRRNNYFVLVQLFIATRSNDFFLDSTRNNPSIKFEGIELSGKVRVSTKIQNEEKFKDFAMVEMQLLNEEKTTELLIRFIESVYSK